MCNKKKKEPAGLLSDDKLLQRGKVKAPLSDIGVFIGIKSFKHLQKETHWEHFQQEISSLKHYQWY